MNKHKRLLFALAAATALTVMPLAGLSSLGFDNPVVGITPANAAATVNIDVFFDPLAPMGQWVKHPQYNYVFCPKVDADWRPYSRGHWVYMNNYGWYFASDEPFAWAVYHYGRWFQDDRVGWCWVPGNAWAGAWVAWRKSNDTVGWAPLQPDKQGFAVNVDISSQEPPHQDWVFVPAPKFLAPKLDVVVQFGDRQPDAFQRTQYVGPVVVQNNIVVNTVIDINFVQQVTKQKVVVVTPKPVNDPKQGAGDAQGTTIALFAPQIAPPTQKEAPKQSVDESQAQPQPGASSQPASGASSSEPASGASSSEPASGASSAPASGPASAASSEASSAASSAAASSSASAPAASSSASEASAMSSSVAPPSSSVEPASSSVAAPPPSSSAESAKPASSVEPPKASSSIEPSSSMEASKAPAAVEPSKAPPSVEPSKEPSSSVEPASKPEATPPANNKKPNAKECPAGEELVKGKCVPLPSAASSAAQ